jgi:hypothetical protein
MEGATHATFFPKFVQENQQRFCSCEAFSCHQLQSSERYQSFKRISTIIPVDIREAHIGVTSVGGPSTCCLDGASSTLLPRRSRFGISASTSTFTDL